jgi:hypothetical protein
MDPMAGAPPMAGAAQMGGGPLSPGPNPMDAGMGAGPVPGPTSQGGSGACAGCGGPLGPDGNCPTCGSSYTAHVAALNSEFTKVAGRLRFPTVTCPPEIKTVKLAKSLIDRVARPHGYQIQQMKRTADGRLSALLGPAA